MKESMKEASMKEFKVFKDFFNLFRFLEEFLQGFLMIFFSICFYLVDESLQGFVGE